jgi:hypothetical protein
MRCSLLASLTLPDTLEYIALRHAQAIPILKDLKAWLDATLAAALP